MNTSNNNLEQTRQEVQKFLHDDISVFTVKGKGAVNNAYYVETKSGSTYIVKQEREDKEFQPQNDLLVEANVIQQLSSVGLTLSIPKVSFISEKPKMYGYEYIEGEMLRGTWPSLSEEEKISICTALGEFHAEIGKKCTKEMAESLGITIDLSTGLHPEVSRDYELILQNSQVPDSFKILARRAKEIFDITEHDILFQFLHNDAHHENVLIKNKQISGIIDFGNAEYGEIAKEFSRYIRDFPFHFQYIVSAYEKASGNKLSYTRLVTNSFLSGLIDTVGDYLKGGEGRVNAEKAMARYKKLIDTYTQTQNPKRILIVGDAGRGKSTFAKKLSAKLGIPAYETDDFYWIKKFSVPANKQESIDAIAKVYLEDTWIVEGTTRHLVQGAFEKADVIYSLEFKWIISQYYRLIKRSFGRDHESWRGLWVLLVHVTRKRFKKGYRAELPSIQEMIKPYESKVVHLCSFKEIQSELHKYNL